MTNSSLKEEVFFVRALNVHKIIRSKDVQFIMLFGLL